MSHNTVTSGTVKPGGNETIGSGGIYLNARQNPFSTTFFKNVQLNIYSACNGLHIQ